MTESGALICEAFIVVTILICESTASPKRGGSIRVHGFRSCREADGAGALLVEQACKRDERGSFVLPLDGKKAPSHTQAHAITANGPRCKATRRAGQTSGCTHLPLKVSAGVVGQAAKQPQNVDSSIIAVGPRTIPLAIKLDVIIPPKQSWRVVHEKIAVCALIAFIPIGVAIRTLPGFFKEFIAPLARWARLSFYPKLIPQHVGALLITWMILLTLLYSPHPMEEMRLIFPQPFARLRAQI